MLRKEALALSAYLVLYTMIWFSLQTPPLHRLHVGMLELVYRILQWVSELVGAGEQKHPLTFGSKQPWQHELSCFLKSATIYTKLGSSVHPLYIALHFPEPNCLCSCVPQLLSCTQTSCNAFHSVLPFITFSSLGLSASSVQPFVSLAN